ncbi:TetR/AcrR family transcriptional regulator [Nocardia cyriacigeorgica]|uniref:Putative regulatory protein, TetR family n=1 Tax=Nocardia cyriacigeorgica (strain GUH-2) TaxID=1127134 RepID=H6QZ62_NOCCG|nr:TetR/AcrR family transcriptional regulator [Nocardia cyriacigeorgica]CCF62816.1 putative regulatory protein, TetR family [Nocardia cyriacigeorgica GUH-2]
MPKITGSSVAEHRAEVEQRLIRAFGDLLAERGYERLTLRDVAERAGVSRSSIYYYHRDKTALLLVWARDQVDRYMRLLDHELAGTDDPAEHLRIVVVTVLSQFALSTSSAQSLAAALPPEQRDVILDHVTPIRERLCEIVERGMAEGVFRADQDPGATAEMILACLETQRLRLARGAELAGAVRQVLPFLLFGVTRQDPGEPQTT